MTQEKSLHVDRDILTALAQAASDCPDLQIDEWQTTTLSVQGQRTITRFAGTGHLETSQNGAAARPWSLILKEIKAPESPDAIDHELDCAFYWPRESLLYAAGVPQALNIGSDNSGLRSPRCFGVVEPTPDLRWIWLEDLQDSYDGDWPLERYVLAAYHLGIFNGGYLAGKPMPTAPWLTGNRLRSESASKVAALEQFRAPEIWAHPLLRRAFPTPIMADLDRLAADRERFLAGAAAFPLTFCHLDAHSKNMAALDGTADEEGPSTETTVLFDWAVAGYGAPGEEISRLIWAALLEFKVDIAETEQLETMVFDSYLRGLADAGWQADPVQVRYAYLMSSVLIFTLEIEAVGHVWDKDVVGLEQYYGWPQERLVEQSAQVTYLLLERAEELRAMLNRG